MTTTVQQLTEATRNAILSSIALGYIDDFNDEHDPEVYSTNINMEVAIGDFTYIVAYQRGTDGEVELAPFADSGLPEVYLALMTLAGEHNGQDESDMCDIFEGDEHDAVSSELYTFAAEVRAKIAEVAEAEQDKFDAEREAELEETPDFGVDAHGNVCDLDSDEAVLQFEHSNERYGNLIRWDVSAKNNEGLWTGAGQFDCFHFHLTPAEVYRRYEERKANR